MNSAYWSETSFKSVCITYLCHTYRSPLTKVLLLTQVSVLRLKISVGCKRYAKRRQPALTSTQQIKLSVGQRRQKKIITHLTCKNEKTEYLHVSGQCFTPAAPVCRGGSPLLPSSQGGCRHLAWFMAWFSGHAQLSETPLSFGIFN